MARPRGRGGRRPPRRRSRGVVVGEDRRVAPHPNADKLRVCKVDAGRARSCRSSAARRMWRRHEGAVRARRRDAARRPRRSSARSCAASNRAACCARRASSGCRRRCERPARADPSLVARHATLREALALDDTLITLKLTPNRGDCLSMLGIAREVAALTGAPLTLPEVAATPVTIDGDARRCASTDAAGLPALRRARDRRHRSRRRRRRRG